MSNKIIHPYNPTLIKVRKNAPETILSRDQLDDLCVDELVYHLNSLNNYLCKVYYEEPNVGVTPDLVAYLLDVQHNLSARFLKSSI
jgi:hypothetical protein